MISITQSTQSSPLEDSDRIQLAAEVEAFGLIKGSEKGLGIEVKGLATPNIPLAHTLYLNMTFPGWIAVGCQKQIANMEMVGGFRPYLY